MGRYLQDIIDRAARREPWRVEASEAGEDRFRVRCPDNGVIADGLPREHAEQISASFNEAREDAAALAEVETSE